MSALRSVGSIATLAGHLGFDLRPDPGELPCNGTTGFDESAAREMVSGHEGEFALESHRQFDCFEDLAREKMVFPGLIDHANESALSRIFIRNDFISASNDK